MFVLLFSLVQNTMDLYIGPCKIQWTRCERRNTKHEQEFNRIRLVLTAWHEVSNTLWICHQLQMVAARNTLTRAHTHTTTTTTTTTNSNNNNTKLCICRHIHILLKCADQFRHGLKIQPLRHTHTHKIHPYDQQYKRNGEADTAVIIVLMSRQERQSSMHPH